MKKHVRWVRGELDAWVGDGLVTDEQADALRRRYPEPEPGLPWGTILFSGIGATIVGLGVILLFAYNIVGGIVFAEGIIYARSRKRLSMGGDA